MPCKSAIVLRENANLKNWLNALTSLLFLVTCRVFYTFIGESVDYCPAYG